MRFRISLFGGMGVSIARGEPCLLDAQCVTANDDDAELCGRISLHDVVQLTMRHAHPACGGCRSRLCGHLVWAGSWSGAPGL